MVLVINGKISLQTCIHSHIVGLENYKYFHTQGWLVGFVALRPKSTAMVIAGRSVHLTTLFHGQA